MPSQFKRRHRAISEPLERRVLLTSATDTAIEKFNLSPALFVENDGQWTDSSVHFVHQGKGASIAMTDRGPVFELYKDDSVKSGLSGGTGVPPVIDPKEQMEEHGRDGRATGNATGADTTEIESTRFAVSFNNANITQPIGHDQSSSTFNYNIGTPDLHRSNVHGFAKIVYPNLYEGIDLHTWGQRDSLKYEFHVAPNIDYRQIAVQYEGVEDLWIDDRGRLHAELGSGFGEVIDDAPVIWQEVKGKRVDVAGRFKLLDGDAYTFELTGK
ncbi:MAG TPA: hypothetical protein PK402_09185, partial [Tepidisphaeraceae bacterium]|nr:hypothetical protein [Tepidisphaeraceae bacterium]